MLDCQFQHEVSCRLTGLADVTQMQRRWEGEGARGRAQIAIVSPQGPEDTIYDGAHADVPAEHVKGDQDSTPSQLSWEVGSHNAEQHHNNVQHNALHQSLPCMTLQTQTWLCEWAGLWTNNIRQMFAWYACSEHTDDCSTRQHTPFRT